MILLFSTAPVAADETAANDSFAQASEIAVPATVSSSSVVATFEPGEPTDCVESASVWFRFRVTEPTPLSVFGTTTGVWRGTQLENLQPVLCSEFWQGPSSAVISPGEYSVQVDGTGPSYYVELHLGLAASEAGVVLSAATSFDSVRVLAGRNGIWGRISGDNVDIRAPGVTARFATDEDSSAIVGPCFGCPVVFFYRGVGPERPLFVCAQVLNSFECPLYGFAWTGEDGITYLCLATMRLAAACGVAYAPNGNPAAAAVLVCAVAACGVVYAPNGNPEEAEAWVCAGAECAVVHLPREESGEG